MRDNSGRTNGGVLVSGALIAGGLALLLSPRTGPRVRGHLKEWAGELARTEAARTVAQRLGAAMGRGIEYAELGQHVLRNASEAMDSAIERGKDYLENGKGFVNKFGKGRPTGWDREGVAIAAALLAGAVIGGGLALLTTPNSGSELRRRIRTYAGRAKQNGEETTDQINETAMAREG